MADVTELQQSATPDSSQESLETDATEETTEESASASSGGSENDIDDGVAAVETSSKNVAGMAALTVLPTAHVSTGSLGSGGDGSSDDVHEKSLFISKIDAGVALTMTSDHYIMELPIFLFPDSVAAGSIVTVTIKRQHSRERDRLEAFIKIQQKIIDAFANAPTPPRLFVGHVTQTSAVLGWDDMQLFGATIQGIDVHRNGQKVQSAVQMQRQQQRIVPSSNRLNLIHRVKVVVAAVQYSLRRADSHSNDRGSTPLEPSHRQDDNDAGSDVFARMPRWTRSGRAGKVAKSRGGVAGR
jgi:hypothetical protein